MKKAKAKKKTTKKSSARNKTAVKKKTAAKKKTTTRKKSKPKTNVRYLTVNPEKEDIFDEVEELRRIETCLDIIFGHLRRIKRDGGEGSLQLILDYFYSKYGTRFFARQ